jgi:hypothetical protein
MTQRVDVMSGSPPLNRNLNRLTLYILQTVQQPFGRSTTNSSATVSLYYKQFSNRFTELHVLTIPHTLQVRSVLVLVFVYRRHTYFNPCHHLQWIEFHLRETTDHSAAYNGARSVDMAWEHQPLSSFREATTCSSLGCDRGFPAKFPSHRRQIVGRCTCPNQFSPITNCITN